LVFGRWLKTKTNTAETEAKRNYYTKYILRLS
jgi:hypothetical protein